MTRPVGLLAGNGVYPKLLADRLARADLKIIAAGLRGQTDPSLIEHVDRYAPFDLGALKRTAAYFTEDGVEALYLAGGVRRPVAWRHLRPDGIAVRLLLKTLIAGDDTLLRGVAAAFAALGLPVADPRPYLNDLLSPPGRLAGPSPTASTLTDLAVAWTAAKAVGRRDGGQAATARGGRVTGVEGKRGTNDLIARAGKGAVLAKVVKPGQDRRFDLPAVGPDTARVAHAAGLTAVAVEAGGVLLLERERLVSAFDSYEISLVGYPSPGRSRESASPDLSRTP